MFIISGEYPLSPNTYFSTVNIHNPYLFPEDVSHSLTFLEEGAIFIGYPGRFINTSFGFEKGGHTFFGF